MPRTASGNLRLFIASFLVCALLFGCILSLSHLPLHKKTAIAADIPYAKAYDTRHSDIRILLTVEHLPVFFLLTLMPNRTASALLCLPIRSIQNSTTRLITPLTKSGISKFLGLSGDAVITLTDSALQRLVDHAGGITVDTPYGLPAPSGNGSLLAADEPLHLYGQSVVALLSSEAHPDYDRLTYSAELIGRVAQNFLADFPPEKYYFLKNETKTDISYSNYYDHAALIEACATTMTFTAPTGVWLNEDYYLQ